MYDGFYKECLLVHGTTTPVEFMFGREMKIPLDLCTGPKTMK